MASDPDLNRSAQWPHHVNYAQPAKFTYPYSPSIASTASSSSDSVFSVDAPSSQSSECSSDSWSTSTDQSSWSHEPEHPYLQDSDATAQLSEDFASTNRCLSPKFRTSYPVYAVQAVAPESRQHPRRTQRLESVECKDGKTRSLCPRAPPPLVRQSERKDNFVDSLVGKLTY